MNKELKLEYLQAIKDMEGKDYLISIIAFGAAPTIRGKKPSSLVSLNNSKRNLFKLWKRYGEEICQELSLESYEIKDKEDDLLVLFFKRPMLKWYVDNKRNFPLLSTMGYDKAMNLDDKLAILKKRFEDFCPHEVGVFLGIPIEDIVGFIEHKGQSCLMCRYWKVYHKPERARILFDIYDEAKSSIAQAVINKKLKEVV